MAKHIGMDPDITAALIDCGLVDAIEPETVEISGPSNTPSAVTSDVTDDQPADEPIGWVDPAWMARLRFALSAKTERGAILLGPAGTGKTSAVHVLAKRMRKKLVTIQCAAGRGLDDLLGSRELRNGESIFVPSGALCQALRDDSILLAEEANMMPAAVWSIVNTLIDGSGDALTLPDGSTIPVGPNFRLVLAYNPGYAGARDVNAALKNRLVSIYCDYMPADHETAMLIARTGIDSQAAAAIVAVGSGLRAARAELRFDCSPRTLLRWVGLVLHLGMTWHDAFNAAVLDEIGDPTTAAPYRESALQSAIMCGMEQIGSAS